MMSEYEFERLLKEREYNLEEQKPREPGFVDKMLKQGSLALLLGLIATMVVSAYIIVSAIVEISQ